MASTAEPSLTVGYWGIRGLCAPLRMMCMYAGTPFKNTSYDLETSADGWDMASWIAAKDGLRAKNALINLPYVQDGDMLVTQTNACMGYLGRKLGLWGKTEVEVSQCEQLLSELMDLRNKMTGYAYSGDHSNDAAINLLKGISKAEGAYPGILAKLDSWLGANAASGDVFFVGNSATAPDFHAWELLDQFTLLARHVGAPDPLAPFPHLAAFHTKFCALPANEPYRKSALASLPCNNKMAVFGSTPAGPAYVRGDPTDWHGSTGVY
ncbi:hypothetical protein FOA52_009953 [Chlamydomonas sp. UWO 241]|nr:hypothetical protein FOA52_009953 [Chlamydomonas sp. UWO 241]